MEFTERVGHAYFFAKKYVISKGYFHEIDWQDRVNYHLLTEQVFLQEIAWVILASGLNDNVVKIKFPLIKEAMLGFKSAYLIVENRKECFDKTIKHFNHSGKINAIISAAEKLAIESFEKVKSYIDNEGIKYLKTFHYIGDATSYHLAKNIGLNFAKPDRHLTRMSIALGFASPFELCRRISDKFHEKVAIVDLVLWRYATLDKRYLEKIERLVGR
jgi:hypothetical protein